MPSTRLPTSITTGPGAPPPGGAKAEDVAASLVAHITDTTGAHAASAISTVLGPQWHNTYTNPAADVQTQLDKIVTDLASESAIGPSYSGADKIGSRNLQAWADGTQILADDVHSQLFGIVNDLRGSTGTRKIKGGAITHSTVTISEARLDQQLYYMSQASYSQYAGGAAWADGTTNPATDVEAQIDKILTELSSTSDPSGTKKLGVQATVVGAVTNGAGTLYDRLEDLQDAVNITAGARPDWRDGTTNPDTNVAAALDQFVNHLNDNVGAQTGSTKIGAPVYPGSAGPDDYVLLVGSVGSQLAQLCDKIHPNTDYKTVSTGGLIVFNQLDDQRCEVRFDSTVGAAESFNWSDAFVTPLDGQRYTLFFQQQTSGAGGGTAQMTSWGKWVFSGAGDGNIAVGLGAITIYEFEYNSGDDLYYCLNKVVFP